MLLICKGMYEMVYSKHGLLTINPYAPENFSERSHYYFRLGAVVLTRDEKDIAVKSPVELRPGESKRVFSLETFTLSDRVWAMFGPRSQLVCSGLAMHHGPTIDPSFNGSLEVVIQNCNDEPVQLTPEMPIGKAIFFDISDTMLDLHAAELDVRREEVLKVRRQVGEMLRKGGLIEFQVDSEAPNPSPMNLSF